MPTSVPLLKSLLPVARELFFIIFSSFGEEYLMFDAENIASLFASLLTNLLNLLPDSRPI